MKVWVIGSLSMLGRCLLKELKKAGIEAIGSTKKEADLTCLDSLKRFSEKAKATHWVNCAAYTQVDKAETNKELAYAINAEGVRNVAKLAKKSSVHLTHISTDYVFDGKGNRPYRERDLCHPCNVYGKTKREGEVQLLEIYPEASIIRTSWLFANEGKNFVSTLLDLMMKKKTLQVVSDQVGRATFCEDLSQAIIASFPFSGLFHYANKGEVSWHQWSEKILSLGREKDLPFLCENIESVSSSCFPSVAKRPLYSVLDTSKIEKQVGLLIPSWEEAMDRYMDNYTSEKVVAKRE